MGGGDIDIDNFRQGLLINISITDNFRRLNECMLCDSKLKAMNDNVKTRPNTSSYSLFEAIVVAKAIMAINLP